MSASWKSNTVMKEEGDDRILRNQPLRDGQRKQTLGTRVQREGREAEDKSKSQESRAYLSLG